MPFDCVDLLEGSDRNEVHALLPLPEEAFLAAGTVYTEGSYRGWLARFEGSGEQAWSMEISLPDELDVQIIDLAADGMSGTWALTSGGRLLCIDQGGELADALEVTGEADLSVAAYAIESSDAGVWIAGTSMDDAWLGLYDPETDKVTNLLLEDLLGYKDEIRAIGRNETEVAVAATVSTSPNHDGDLPITASTETLVIYFDLQGNETGRTLVGPSPDPASARRALSVSSDATGRWFVGGVHQPLSPFVFSQIWTARVHADSSWQWTSTSSADSAEFGGMVGVEDGVLTAAGWSSADSPSASGWIGGLSSDGSPNWHFVPNADRGFDDHAHSALAVSPDGRIRVGSKTWTAGEISQLRSCLVAQ